MADDPNEVLKEIAAMQGIGLEEEVETPVAAEQQEVSDGQEEKGLEVEADEGREEVLEEEGEEESLDSRYARLLELVNEQSAQLNAMREAGYNIGAQPAVVTPSSPPPAAPQVPVSTPPPAPAPAFSLNEELLSRALIEDDPAAMKEVLMGLVQHINSQIPTREALLRDLPAVAQNVTRQQLTLMRAVDQFYEDNPDLLPHAQTVGNVANRIVAAEPGLSLYDTFKRAETETRKLLGLKKRVAQVDAAEGRGKPAFAKVKAARKPEGPSLQGLRGEIAQMQKSKW